MAAVYIITSSELLASELQMFVLVQVTANTPPIQTTHTRSRIRVSVNAELQFTFPSVIPDKSSSKNKL